MHNSDRMLLKEQAEQMIEYHVECRVYKRERSISGF